MPLVFVVLLVTAPFDKGRYWPGWLFRKLCVVHTWLNPLWTFRTSGVKIADPRRPYVVVANHESFADMFLISHLPWEMKWLSKERLLQVSARRLADADGRRHQAHPRRQAEHRVGDAGLHATGSTSKVSVMLFPEGTRTLDGGLGEFKDGAFRLAIETGHPILPLAVHGTREAIPKGDWRFDVTTPRCACSSRSRPRA